MTAPDSTAEATAAAGVRDTITGKGWIAGGLPAGGSMAALDATLRPIDALNSAGLGWLTAQVQPLQDVLDRMAGKSSVIQSFADGWQRTSDQVEQVHQLLSRSAPTDTADWRGAAGDAYRQRAAQITEALRGSAVLSAAMTIVARTMGEVTASARESAGDLVSDLVNRLISYVSQAKAVEGGVTPNAMSQATSLINSYRAPIADIAQKLGQTIDNIEPILISLAGGDSLGAASAGADGTAGAATRGYQLAGNTKGYGGSSSSSSPSSQNDFVPLQIDAGPKIIDPRTGRPKSGGIGPIRIPRVTPPARPGAPARPPSGGNSVQGIWSRIQRALGWKQYDKEQKASGRKHLMEYIRKNERGENYRKELQELYGPPPGNTDDFVAHHNYPVKNHGDFERLGVDTTNPAYGSWVNKTDHAKFSDQYEKLIDSYFRNTPNPTLDGVNQVIRDYAKDHNYELPDIISGQIRR